MKNYTLITVPKQAGLCIAYASVVFATACADPVKTKLQGTWRSKDGETHLKITDKQFTMDSDSPVPEDYFVKEDTIFTSFEGNQPYTKFVIEQIDEHYLKLSYPDSTAVDFIR